MVEPDEGDSGETAGGYAKEMSADYQKRQAELVAEHIAKQDIVICTALIPGRPAPELVTRKMVESMKPGSVIVDLAVEQGGNCKLSKPGKIVQHKGVALIGHQNVPGRLAGNASELYARNILNFIDAFFDKDKKQLAIDWEDEIVLGIGLTRGGEIVHEALAPPAKASPAKRSRQLKKQPNPSPRDAKPLPRQQQKTGTAQARRQGSIIMVNESIYLLSIFVLAVFVGYYVVWSVTPALHTPLMSVTNAISSVIIVGAILAIGVDLGVSSVYLGDADKGSSLTRWLGFGAIVLASINIFGGFLVTQRMLAMYRKKD